MAGFTWTEEEDELVKELVPLHGCKIVGKKLDRTTRAVQHRAKKLDVKLNQPKVGDIIKNWEIVELYEKDFSNQKRTMAKVKSKINGDYREIRLSALKKGNIVDQLNDRRGGSRPRYK